MHLSCSKKRCVPHSLCVLACAQACAVGFCLFVRQVHIFVKTLFVIITRDVFVSAIKSLIHRVCVCVCARLTTTQPTMTERVSGLAGFLFRRQVMREEAEVIFMQILR